MSHSPASEPRTVTILGCTGSVGTQTVDLLRAAPGRFQVKALAAGSKVDDLTAQAREFQAELAVVADPACYGALKDALAGTGIRAAAGPDAVVEAAAMDADWTMAAITGAAGLAPTLAAIRRGKSIALANKEALVCAGDVMLRAVADAGATLLPVDSEHNAILQSMADGNRGGIERIVLTASGGPFRTATLDEMRRATRADALKHPTWVMGPKITIDSASMFNKGLEVIEAARLFGLDESEIDVLIHPQSVIHGMVCYKDGSVMAQLGSPDMRVPIAHTLAWPARMATHARRLDLAAMAKLEFEPPDPVRFPALRLARQALKQGGGAPAILNAANEVAVETFLQDGIGFLGIAELVERTMDKLGPRQADTIGAVVALDQEARGAARALLPALAA
jgi:1-deoxy-D-xylulose-5-phosphate reductoisomerase